MAMKKMRFAGLVGLVVGGVLVALALSPSACETTATGSLDITVCDGGPEAGCSVGAGGSSPPPAGW